MSEHEVGGEERVLLEQLEAQVVVRVARRQARTQRRAIHTQLAAVRHVLPPQLALTCCLREAVLRVSTLTTRITTALCSQYSL